jgi:hypothetical protein
LVGKNEIVETRETAEIIDKLLEVIDPISAAIKGTSEPTAIDERNIIVILKNRHERKQPFYEELDSELKSNEFQLSQDKFQLLNDNADALDVECANLFRRMSGRW